MKVLVIIVLLILILFVLQIKQPQEVTAPPICEEDMPRYYPVYIDHSTTYLNEPILYSEWPQAPLEISSSL